MRTSFLLAVILLTAGCGGTDSSASKAISKRSSEASITTPPELNPEPSEATPDTSKERGTSEAQIPVIKVNIIAPTDFQRIKDGTILKVKLNSLEQPDSIEFLITDPSDKNFIDLKVQAKAGGDGYYYSVIDTDKLGEDRLYNVELADNFYVSQATPSVNIIVDNLPNHVDENIIDDFEGYYGNSKFLNLTYHPIGENAAISLKADEIQQSKYSGLIKYNFLLDGFSGVEREFNHADWSQNNHLIFSIVPDTNSLLFVIRIESNGLVWEAYRVLGKNNKPILESQVNRWGKNNLYIKNIDSSQRVEIAFSEFIAAPDKEYVGQHNFSNVSRATFIIRSLPDGDSPSLNVKGVLVLDDFQLQKKAPFTDNIYFSSQSVKGVGEYNFPATVLVDSPSNATLPLGIGVDETQGFYYLDPENIGLESLFLKDRSYRNVRSADLNGDNVSDLISNVYNVGIYCGQQDSVSRIFYQELLQNGEPSGRYVEQKDIFPFNSPLALVGRGETILAADFNNDDYTDLYFPQYAANDFEGCGYDLRSYMLISDGNGGFRDISAEGDTAENVGLRSGSWGVENPDDRASIEWNYRPEGAEALDFNDDGHIDFYVASHFFINLGNGSFTDKQKDFSLPLMFDEGMKFLDWNNDGYLDLLIIDPILGPRLFESSCASYSILDKCLSYKFAERFSKIDELGSFFSNEDGESVAYSKIFANTYGVQGVGVFDLDNDGREDIIVMAGKGEADEGTTFCNTMFFKNTGLGFSQIKGVDIFTFLGLGGQGQGGLSFGDFNKDGKIDIVYPSGGDIIFCYPYRNDMSLHLLINQTINSNYTFEINLYGPNGEKNQQGRVVRANPIHHPNVTYTRIVDGGSGYMSQNQYSLLVGTRFNEPHKIEIRFGSRENDVFTFEVNPGQVANVYLPSKADLVGRPKINIVEKALLL